MVENPAVQEQVIIQEVPPFSIVERMQAPQVVGSFPFLEDFAATVQSLSIFQEIPQVQGVERFQEPSAITDLVTPPISITAVEGVDSFSVSENVALNTSSTSTSSAARAPHRPATTVLVHSRACLTHALSNSLLWRVSMRSLKGLRRSPSGCWRLLCRSLPWWSLIVLLRNAVDEHGKRRCPGSWKTQCTWLQVLGFTYRSDTEKIRHHTSCNELGAATDDHPIVLTEALPNPMATRECMAQIIFDFLNVHAMYVASLSCLCPLRDGRRAL